ncbi:hypothetical protein [Vogesella sp. EB]|uniref:hypothetical protein n=1 Tax=Vogesella sp. EB TaxID=1526735 RepID=UPI00069E7F83|nr:hypothetical protein [Vogesella sp. EB]
MPIPDSIDDLDPSAANNSPGGSEPIGPNLDSYLRAHAAIIRQVSDASKVETQIHGATSKATPVDADELPIADSEALFGRKKLTFASLKAWVKSLVQAGLTMTGVLKFAAGGSIASAATVDLASATGNTVHITGTTGISAWAMTAGQFMQVIFDGALTLAHHATNNNLQGGTTITTAAGDRAFLYYDGTTVYVFQYIRADGTPLVGQRMTLTAAVATTSGTVIDLTGFPSWAKRITVLPHNVSTNGNNNYLLQLGTPSGIENTGYSNNVNAVTGSSIVTVSSTSGILLSGASGTSTSVSGAIRMRLQSGNVWEIEGDTIRNGEATNNKTVGNKTLAGVLDRIRLTTTTAVDTFDAGSVSLLIEGY